MTSLQRKRAIGKAYLAAFNEYQALARAGEPGVYAQMQSLIGICQSVDPLTAQQMRNALLNNGVLEPTPRGDGEQKRRKRNVAPPYGKPLPTEKPAVVAEDNSGDVKEEETGDPKKEKTSLADTNQDEPGEELEETGDDQVDVVQILAKEGNPENLAANYRMDQLKEFFQIVAPGQSVPSAKSKIAMAKHIFSKVDG